VIKEKLGFLVFKEIKVKEEIEENQVKKDSKENPDFLEFLVFKEIKEKKEK
jgi:hypothetical protein